MQHSNLDATSFQVLFNILIFILLYYSSVWNKIRNNNIINTFVIFLIITFCTYTYWSGDYFHYYDIYVFFQKNHIVFHLEDIYEDILLFSSTYETFRLCIWGSGILIILFSAKLLHVKQSQILYLFIIFYLLKYSYARAAFAITILSFGYILLLKYLTNKRNIILLLLSVFILIFSTQFHDSIVMALAVVPLSFIPLNKHRIILLMVFYPLLVYIVNTFFFPFILNNIVDEEDVYVSAIENTTTILAHGKNVGTLVVNTLTVLPIYLSMAYLIHKVYFLKIEISKTTHYLLNFSFLLIYTSALFAFLPNNQDIYYFRILFMSYVPLIFVLSRYISSIGVSKYLNYIFYLAAFNQLYTLIYKLYSV